MAFLLCGASLLCRLGRKLHKECKKTASASSSASAAGAAAPPVAAAVAVASSAARFAPASSVPAAAPAAVIHAAAAARAAEIIPRKALPEIPFCSALEHALAKLLGMKAPPASYRTLPPVNLPRISALSRDGNPPAACSSLPSIEEGEEPLLESTDSFDDDRLSVCLSFCSSLRPSDHGTEDLPLVDPLFTMLWTKVQTEVGEESDDDDNDDDDDDDDDENCSCTSCLHEHQAVQEKCSAFLSLSSGAFARENEPTFPSSSVLRLSSSLVADKDESEPVGVEQDLDSSFLRPAPLTIRKKVVGVPPVAHPEPLRVLVTYPRGGHRKLHPALDALCLHLNA